MLRKCYLCPALPVSRIVDMSVVGLFVCLFKKRFPVNNQLPSIQRCYFVCPCSPHTGTGNSGRKTLPYFKL